MDKWATEEFGGAELGDVLLTKRLIKIAPHFSDQPTASIPGACPDCTEAQTTYRFSDQAIEGLDPLRSCHGITGAHAYGK